MKDDFRLVFRKNICKGRIGDIQFVKGDGGRFLITGRRRREIVNDGDLPAVTGEALDELRTDESRSARYQCPWPTGIVF